MIDDILFRKCLSGTIALVALALLLPSSATSYEKKELHRDQDHAPDHHQHQTGRHADDLLDGDSKLLFSAKVPHPVLDEEKCTLADGPKDPVPDYLATLEGSYTLQLEMTDTKNRVTYYVLETREATSFMGNSINEVAVSITSNATDQVIYYYPDKNTFVEYKNGVCTDKGTDCPFCPWGWLDIDHEGAHYGPSSILRMAHYITVEYFSDAAVHINDVECQGWKACANENDVELIYYYSIPSWEMPDVPYFGTDETRFPVNYHARYMNNANHWEYNVVQFLPFVTNHHNLEPPRGANCEGMVGIIDDFPVPSMPQHFSFRQEVVVNPMIDGIQAGEQVLDKSLIYYSQDLSLIRFDFVPAIREETPFLSLHPLKVVQDYNTGVEYFIDLQNGNCTRARLMSIDYNSHSHGFYGSAGEMVGPDEFLKLTGNYAFLGTFYDRHIEDQRWTSTRDDILDPATGITFKKAVLEWEFLLFSSDYTKSESGDIPVRANTFIYNEEDPSKIDLMVATNVYDYTAISLHSVDEFDVFQCYEYHNYDWSYLLIAFPTDSDQYSAVTKNPDEVHHQIFDLLIKYGQMSPVRISSIEISNGVQGMDSNHTSTSVMVASVRVLERAPYIYSYSLDEGTSSVPGVNEMKYARINNAYECAEFCSTNVGFDCKSFHVCDHQDCYLSRYEESDGEPVTGVTDCEHWVMALDNITFVDQPTVQAVETIWKAVQDKLFFLMLHYSGEELLIYATEVLPYYSPDPMAIVTSEFYLDSRHVALTHPVSTFDKISTLEECETLCLGMQEFRCESVAFGWEELLCQVSSVHSEDLGPADTEPRSHTDIFARAYLTEYKPVLGGVQLNTTGPVYNGITHLETCARLCTKETSIDCRSFDVCFDSRTCSLHKEGFLDGTTGGDYNTQTFCTHFARQTRFDFKEYSNQGLPPSQHRLVLTETTAATCAQLCLDDTEEVCESFDYCELCMEDEVAVCGQEGPELAASCYLSGKHLGEEGVALVAALHCQHYDREYFGDMSYATWKDTQIKSQNKAYTPGDMAGLAFGMIFLGIVVSAGFLFAMAYARKGNLPKMTMSFSNLKKNDVGSSS